MRVFGWVADAAGCGWYRIVLPFTQLRHDSRYLWDADWSNSANLAKLVECDVVVAQRTCLPKPSQYWQALAAMPHRPGLVFELDDDLFSVEPSNAGAYRLFGDPEVQTRLRENMKVADVVTVTTQALADRVRQYNDHVVVLPNCIPDWLVNRDLVHRGPPDQVTLGWQGSPTHDSDWVLVDEQVARVLKSEPHAELHLMGGHAPTETLARVASRVSGWEALVDRHYRAIDWDIALAPLAATEFNRSKSPIRLLEAAALGIPAVAADTPPYDLWLAQQQGGSAPFAVGVRPAQVHRWHSALRDLINDPAQRSAMGHAARSVALRWTIQARIDAWASLYTSIAP